MNSTALQRWLDEMLETSSQQWLLRALAVATSVGAVLSAAAANERWWPAGLVVVSGLAIASAIRPDSYTALAVVVVIVWHWLATVEGPGGPWLLIASLCLLVYHAVIALSASLPTGGELSDATVVQWLRRTALGGGMTTVAWFFVVLLDRRDAAGNGLLTAVALAVLAAGAMLIRSRSLDQPR